MCGFWFTRFRGPFLGESLEVIEDAADLGLIRVELSPIPFQHLVVFFVLGVGHGFKEVSVAGAAPHILRRASTDGPDQAWICGTRDRPIDFLDLDHVVPVVAKIIDAMDGLGSTSSITSIRLVLLAGIGPS